jgi:membrane protease YdiL (CAAX protease family)
LGIESFGMTTTDVAERPGAASRGLLARHPLISFFIVAYTGTWLVVLPYVRCADGAGLLPFRWPIPFAVSAAAAPFAGPFLAALLMAGIRERRAGIGRLLRRIVRWQVGLRWYLFVLVGIPAIIVLGAIVLPGVLASFQMPAVSWGPAYLVSFVVAFFIGGPLGEETGWRGFALPRLQRLYGPLVGTLILAPLHVLWHLPLFWIPQWGTPRDTILDLLWYALSGIALTFLYTWLFNNTRGSVLLAALAHASVDAFFVGQFFAATVVSGASNLPLVTGFVPAALLLVILTRGRLGYERYQREEPNPAPAPTGE